MTHIDDVEQKTVRIPRTAEQARHLLDAHPVRPETNHRRGQKMTPLRIAQAHAMRLTHTGPLGEIADALGVSRSTLHRHLQ